jgi:hypothetical protein
VELLKKRRGKAKAPRSVADTLLQFAGKAKGLPDDIASNHDHYLHGLNRK